MPMPRKQEPEKFCEFCGARLQRKVYNGRLEDLGAFKRRKYCNLKCANSKKHPTHWGTHHWRARRHRKEFCEACGITESLHAHHVDGNFKNDDPLNIQTLCTWCHHFLHATAERLGWEQPGKMPSLR